MYSHTAIAIPEKEAIHPRIMSKKDSSSEATLFERHLSGDDAAFMELFHRWNHKLYLYCLKLVADDKRAEDVTQELWEKIIRLRMNAQKVENPVGLFLKIAKNLCLNSIRARKRETFLPGDTEWSAYRNTPAPSDFEEAVQVALQALSVADREVLVLSVYWGYSMQEIADLMNTSTNAVWKRASRARQKLRQDVLTMVNPPKTGHRKQDA
jgi:RNA polymerase sigma factor (sigma-70 family)